MNWYRDENGKLWIYVSMAVMGEYSQVLRLAWGTRDLKPLNLGFGDSKTVGELNSPMPGVQLIKVKDEQGGIRFFSINSGTANEISWMRGFNPGDWVRKKDGDIITPLQTRFGISKVFLSGDSVVRVLADRPLLTFEKDAKAVHPKVPHEGWLQTQVNYLCVSGHDYLIMFYHLGSRERLAIWDLTSSLDPVLDEEMDFQYELSNTWLRAGSSAPLLAYSALADGKSTLVAFDLFTRTFRLKQSLPGTLTGWFELGGESYFYIHSANHDMAIYKVFSQRDD